MQPKTAIAMTEGSDEQTLARDMIAVHGTEAATVARENARTAALAGRPAKAKSWIRVLGVIQRRRFDKTSPLQGPGFPPPPLPAAPTAEG